MPTVNNFPRTFAVIRAQALRGPCVQILSSTERNGYSYIENAQNVDDFLEAQLLRMESYRLDPTILTLHYKTERYQRERGTVKFWALPFYFRIRNHQIPVLEFQYRSWIPDEYSRIPIRGNTNDLIHVAERIEQERLYEIRRLEDSSVDPLYDAPRFYQPGAYGGADDWDDRTTNDFRSDYLGAGASRRYPRIQTPPMPPPPPYRTIRSRPHTPEERVHVVEVAVERIVTQVRPQPIPKHVGDILISNARKGPDSCPIAASTFAECEKLSVSSCFHIFDKESLGRWMETSNSCPVCRCKIENVVSE